MNICFVGVSIIIVKGRVEIFIFWKYGFVIVGYDKVFNKFFENVF